VDTNSSWTAGHSERVTDLARNIGRELRLPPHEINLLHRGGLLHDIGKIGVPPSILDKPGKLTEEEFAVIRSHPSKGVAILRPIPNLQKVLPIVLQHHERYDGKGYPNGLSGESISLHARILALADVVDALLSDRPYRPGWSREKVLAYTRENSGLQFDPTVVEAYKRMEAGRREAPLEPRRAFILNG
jgi:putative nucleotidyltransferase with HDIG domain